MPQENELRELFRKKNVDFDLFEVLYSIVCSTCKKVHFFFEGERIVFRSSTGFLYVWFSTNVEDSKGSMVVSILSPERLDSDRFSLVVPCQKGFMHHINISSTEDFDEDFVSWIRDASAYSKRALAY